MKSSPALITPLISAQESRLEHIGRTRSGIEFDASGPRWSYRDNVTRVSLNFELFDFISPALYSSVRSLIMWYIQNHAPGTALAAFKCIRHFTSAAENWRAVIDSIDAVDLLNYRASLTKKNAHYLGALGSYIRRWHALGYPGINESAIKLLNSLRIKGAVKGVAVLTLDPYSGPFTNIESESIHAALNLAYAANKIETPDFILAWLYIFLGQRNMQYAALKICDFKVSETENGVATFSLMVPRVKQGNITPRHEFTERPLVSQFGEVLAVYIESIRKEFSPRLSVPDQAPLFPSQKLKEQGSPGFEYHQTAQDLGNSIKRSLQALRVFSERTGDQINIIPTRFRRTIGTRAAEEGHGPLVIAQMLDHTDTQNVMVYSASTPAIIERIDRAIAMQMAPLAQAFAGVLVDGSNGPRIPTKRIIDLRIDRSGNSMGECGQHSFCGFNAPIACYTCKNFEAWLDGPHEAVFEHLLKERERLLKTSDTRIASVNDRTLLAVAAVIQKCADIKQELKGKLNG